MRYRRRRSVADIALIVVFASVISAPLVGMWLGIGQLQESEEKRPLAPRPDITADFRSWPATGLALTACFNDHFGFRKTLVEGHAAMLVKGLGESTSPVVFVGKHGWLYLTLGLSPDSFHGQESFGPGRFDQWLSALRRMHDWLATRHIRFYVIIPPDKHTIYPEYLPTSAKPGPGATRLDTLIAALRQAKIGEVDLRDDLVRAKAMGPLYYHTDTHWNGNGAYVAYRAITLELGKAFPQIRPKPPSDFSEWRPVRTGDLNLLLGLTHGYDETFLYLVEKNTPVSHREGNLVIDERNDPRQPRMVMLRDSFANYLRPLLSQNFNRATYVFSNNFDTALIEREKPDLVLFELVERRLAEDAPLAPTCTTHAIGQCR
jgi:alginate O-acetyltransferase complex protein AlgJ